MEPYAVVGSSLFPAYSGSSKETKDEQVDKEDWLCNSSYSPANFQDPFDSKNDDTQQGSDVEIIVEKKKKHLKKAKKKHKKKLISPIKKHQKPESESFPHDLLKKTFLDETGLPFEKAFRLDQKCNPENMYYEALEQKHIAKYSLHPKTAFGFTPEEQYLLFPPLSTATKKKAIRYFSKKALKSFLKANCDRPTNVSGTLVPTVSLEFIPLHSKEKTSDQNEITPDFISASQSWRLPSVPNQESDQEKTTVEVDTDTSEELRNKTISFNKQLTESPHNIQLWLDFVEFQEEVYSSKESKGFSEVQLIEKKIAILDKALSHNPRSVKLSITKLNLCRSVWTIEKVIKGWDDLIFYSPNDSQVWTEYVTFILTDLTYFSVPRVLKVFSKCLRTLSDLSEGVIQSHTAPKNVIYNMLDVFSQLCFILKSCGYTEKAIAAYQAMIEFNLYCPPSIASFSVSDKISSFEPFWDSGAARFGEDGAIGWDTTVSEKKILFNKIVSQSDLSHMEDNILYQKYPEWRTWLEFERLRERHHWFPWKPNPEYDQTDDDIDDPDRTVSFDDVSKFLFFVPTEAEKFMLIHHFIKFLNFNPHEFGCKFSLSDSSNTNIIIDNFDIISKTLNESLFNSHISSPLYFGGHVFTQEQESFIRNVFTQATHKVSPKFKVLLLRLWLKFLQHLNSDKNEKKGLEKIAKNLLKENRNCLVLWHEYIKIELLSGSKSKAKKTFETLLTSSSSAVIRGEIETKELWYFIRSYIDICIGIKRDCIIDQDIFSDNEIVWLLVQIGSKERYIPYSNELILTPTQILKSVSGFKNLLNHELNSVEREQAESELCYCLCPSSYSALDCLKCFVYFHYFAQGMDSAVQALEVSIALIKELPGSYKKFITEELCVFQAELMNFHTKVSTSSMKPLKAYLYESIRTYPSNSRLFLILLKWRSASSVVSPTRRFFAQILKENYKAQPVTWVFAIASELAISSLIDDHCSLSTEKQSSDNVTACLGMKWKIRSLYERALHSAECAYIPILWRSYIKYEILNGEKEKAESIFHQALQNCGWSKGLIVNGVEYFPEKLKQTIDFMVEKQIRVHTPLEEITLLVEHGMEKDASLS